MIEFGAGINFPTYLGKAPLPLAILKKNEILVKALIEKGANVERKDQYDRLSALQLALEMGSMDEIVTMLITNGANVNRRFPISKNTPMHEAVSGNRKNCLKSLMDHGGDQSLKNKKGDTPNEVALEKKSIGMFKVLLYNQQK